MEKQKEVKDGDYNQRKGIPTSLPSLPRQVKSSQPFKNVEDDKKTSDVQGDKWGDRIQDQNAQDRPRTHSEAVRKHKEDDTVRLEGASKFNDHGPSQVRNEQASDEEERKRIAEAEYLKKGHTHKKSKRRQKIKQLEGHVKELMEENEQLQNRLRAAGDIKITDNNPNVTDLSDADKPDKLLETFSELYNNEWTDAYKNLIKLQGKQVDQSVKLLLQVLKGYNFKSAKSPKIHTPAQKEAYGICISSRKESSETLRKAMLFYVGLSGEDSIDVELNEIEKQVLEYRKKKSNSNLTRVEKEVKQKFRDQLERDLSNKLSLYIDGCVRICWFMCIKNPPVHLDFGEVKESTTTNDNKPVISDFDKSKFSYYTKSGVYIDYVVWPAVYRQEGGQIMKKGVAQGL